MSLLTARTTDEGPPLPLPEGPPFSASALIPWVGRCFDLAPGDPRLPPLFRGEPAPIPPLENLVGAFHAWSQHPAYMDFLDPRSPNHEAKLTERAIYLDLWAPHLPASPARVLDAGGGIGRFTTWFLDRGDDVFHVEPDLRSLWRAIWHAAGRRGRLEAFWTTVEHLPPLAPMDVIVAAELLCYVADPAAAVDALAEALKPGGLLLASVEARWGWAFSQDAPPGTLDAWLGDGIVHVPGDRWVRTFEADAFRAVLAPRFDLISLTPTHYGFSGAFEAVAGTLDEAGALALDARLREHPRGRDLNRAWVAVARRRA